jgi:hypothetical protein
MGGRGQRRAIHVASQLEAETPSRNLFTALMTVSFSELTDYLSRLRDENPAEAIAFARQLSGDDYLESLKASTLIDSGITTDNIEAVKEGVIINRKLLCYRPDDPYISYNLANGLHGIAQITPFHGPDWYSSTHELRSEARFLFNLAARERNADSELTTQAHTNFGNLLNFSFRWVEAYDAYLEALKYDPSNGVASSGACKVLRRCLQLGLGDEASLTLALNRLSDITRRSQDKILRYAGLEALRGINAENPEPNDESISPGSNRKRMSEFKEFIKSHRLTLSLSIEGADLETRRWDNLHFESVIMDPDAGHGVPPIFAMFNVIKADYILARWLAFNAIHKKTPDSGVYSDTLDYSVYGTTASLLTLSQRSLIDILDKIAVASLEYFRIGGAKSACFRTAWFTKSRDLKKQISEAIINGNPALIALTEIAKDLSDEKGYLKEKHILRRASTHRFVVLHDFSDHRPQQSTAIDHHQYRDFVSNLIETLKLARSSIIYFVEMIIWSETIKRRTLDRNGGHLVPLDVPFHHAIRGDH